MFKIPLKPTQEILARIALSSNEDSDAHEQMH